MTAIVRRDCVGGVLEESWLKDSPVAECVGSASDLPLRRYSTLAAVLRADGLGIGREVS
jgi:hypothetical protein